MDIAGVRAHVEKLLSNLDSNLYYHSPSHSLRDVHDGVLVIGEAEGLTADEMIIVRTAALYHDTGFLDQYDKNEVFGAKRAREDLPGFGYTSEQIELVCQCIAATEVPQRPGDSKLARVLCDADLGSVGSPRFFLNTECLRMELNAVKGLNIAPRKWNESNLKFMADHTYWTDAAKRLWQPRKLENIRLTRELLGLPEEASSSA